MKASVTEITQPSAVRIRTAMLIKVLVAAIELVESGIVNILFAYTLIHHLYRRRNMSNNLFFCARSKHIYYSSLTKHIFEIFSAYQINNKNFELVLHSLAPPLKGFSK